MTGTRALLLAALLSCAAAACEDDSAYKAGKPLNTTGGPMDGGADIGAVDALDAAAPDGPGEGGAAD